MFGTPGSHLHSRYQPQAEADRYIEALNLPSDSGYCVFIEPGQGYLISALQKYRPGSKPVTLHADTCFRNMREYSPDVPAWFPDSGISVQEFLEKTIPEAAPVRIIEWRPSLRVYGAPYLELVRESTEFIKRAEASRRTGAAFGRRWVRNFFRNLTLLHTGMLYRVMDVPVVITGSGPSLESVLPDILAARKGCFILAASSSLPALAAGGITPDMVITTDGGGWALVHLQACLRYMSSGAVATPLAFALTAALPSQCSAIPMLPLNDGSLWQNIVLHALGIPSVLIPQRGTVTASALDLAAVLSGGNIFLAGMDLSVRDIRTHARPYGFDFIFFGAASRFRPVYSQYFMRSGDIRAGGSHDVYAAWFKTKIGSPAAGSWPERIFSLGNNHPVFAKGCLKPGLPELTLQGERCNFFEPVTVSSSPAERCDCALDALSAALHDPQHSDVLTGELAPLLFPGVSGVSAADIIDVLRGYTRQYGGKRG